MPQVFVSIGSSFHRKKNVRAALQALHQRYGEIRYSSVYETEAVGFKGDPFFNLVVGFDTDDDPRRLKQCFHAIEERQGRSRSGKMPGPCPLDLDLLLYDDMIIDTPSLRLPREDVLKHAFVLEPLAELVPERCYPGTNQCYRDLWRNYCRQHDTRSLARLNWDPLAPDHPAARDGVIRIIRCLFNRAEPAVQVCCLQCGLTKIIINRNTERPFSALQFFR